MSSDMDWSHAAVQSLFSSLFAVGDSGECWEWRGRRHKKGYGLISCCNKQAYAHRMAYMIRHGIQLSPWQIVRHDCDNPPCVNPHHLLLGTSADNTRDMMNRGRNRYILPPKKFGEEHQGSILTDEIVVSIHMRKMRGETGAGIAKSLGMDGGYVRRIIRGEAWPHIATAMRSSYADKAW